MKKTTSTLFILFAITILFTSCANYYYSPNDGDLVMLRKQNDGHISAASNLGGDQGKKTLNVQAGYSPINHFALAGSYFKISDGEKNTRYGNGYILNGAIGGYYFFPTTNYLAQKRKRNRRRSAKHPNLKMEKGILVDLYAGSGEGKVRNFYSEGGRSQFKFRKDYFQFGIHFIQKNWGLSYNIRRGWLNYSEGQIYNRLKIGDSDLQKFQNLTDNNSFDLIEQSFRLYVGIKHCRYFFTISSVDANSDLIKLGVEDNNFSAGFILEIDEFFRHRIKKEKEDEKIDF